MNILSQHIMSEKEKKVNRRDFVVTASYAVGAVGVAGVVWPLVDQMNPDASVKALASTEVDISSVEPGKSITVLWEGNPFLLKEEHKKKLIKLDQLTLVN